jgi:hypothetical protein
MSALAFLIARGVKNGFVELIRKPKKLILYLIALAYLIFVVALSFSTTATPDNYADILWLKGAAFAYFLFIFIMSAATGLSKGGSFFGMEDVNFLFVSPLSPRLILVYGVVRMTKSLLISGVFLVMFAPTLRVNFGIGLTGVAWLFAAFFLFATVLQFLVVYLYSITNGRPRRKTLAKCFLVLCFAPVAAATVWHLYAEGWDFAAGASALLGSPVVSFTPFTGWTAAGFVAFVTGDYAAGALFFGLMALAGATIGALFSVGNADYYEDVLGASEKTFAVRQAMAEGKVNFEGLSDNRVRVKDTGVKGEGASALFYKHVRESFRANRFGLWGAQTVLLTTGALVYTLIMSRTSDSEFAGERAYFSLLIMIMYVQVFLIGKGRGLTETFTHYIYLLPDSPFKKMVWANMEVMLKVGVESVLIFGAAGLATGRPPLVTLLSMAVYTLFAFLLVGVNYVSLRFTGADAGAGVMLALYMLAVILVMAPGIVAAIVVGVLPGGPGFPGGLAVLSAWELLVGAGCFAASSGILHNCDMAMLRGVGK